MNATELLVKKYLLDDLTEGKLKFTKSQVGVGFIRVEISDVGVTLDELETYNGMKIIPMVEEFDVTSLDLKHSTAQLDIRFKNFDLAQRIDLLINHLGPDCVSRSVRIDEIHTQVRFGKRKQVN